MAYYYSRKLNIPFKEALEKLTVSLQQQGFGIVTTIDMSHVMREKLKVNFRNYKILGACNPDFAYHAISLDSHIGVMLPCNLVVEEHENGEVEVAAISPLETIGKTSVEPQILDIAREVDVRLRKAVDNLHRDKPGPNDPEALPRDEHKNTFVPLQG